MRLIFNGKRFIFLCHFVDRETPRRAGFVWSAVDKHWFTPHYPVAARLRDYADRTAKDELNRLGLTVTPWAGRIPHPETETPYPWQLDAARFALSRNRSYLGLDPRLGKLITAVLIDNADPLPTVYLCPPFLAPDVKAKFERWGTLGRKVEFYSGYGAPAGIDVLVVPDTRLLKPAAFSIIRKFIRGRPARLFLDEAHRFKTVAAARTETALGFGGHPGILKLFSHAVFLSGTPMPNRPRELYPVLAKAAPELIGGMSEVSFGVKYCAGFQTERGWDFSGASNLPELAKKVIGPFMLRLRTKDVTADLPAEIEDLVIVGDNLTPTLARMDAKILREHSPEDLMGHLAPNDSLATYRRELGILKAAKASEYVREILESTDESILVYAIHKEVIKKLDKALYAFRPFVVTGETKPEHRVGYADAFQRDPGRRLFIGNADCMGLGLDLSKANRVIFCEFSYVPGVNEQAARRAFKIGKTDSIFIQYLVFKNSVDRAVMEAVLRKRKNLAHI